FLYMVYNIARWYYSSTVRNTVSRVAAAAATSIAATARETAAKVKEVAVAAKEKIVQTVLPSPQRDPATVTDVVTTCEPTEQTCDKCKVIDRNGENVCVPRTETVLVAPVPTVIEETAAPPILAPVPLVRELSPEGERAALRARESLTRVAGPPPYTEDNRPSGTDPDWWYSMNKTDPRARESLIRDTTASEFNTAYLGAQRPEVSYSEAVASGQIVPTITNLPEGIRPIEERFKPTRSVRFGGEERKEYSPVSAPSEPGTFVRYSPSGERVVIPAKSPVVPQGSSANRLYSEPEEVQFQRIPVVTSPEGKLRPSEGGPVFSPEKSIE
ncbi:MAG: hypothetical protein Solivirus6_1, partial [Solivirus sp.]